MNGDQDHLPLVRNANSAVGPNTLLVVSTKALFTVGPMPESHNVRLTFKTSFRMLPSKHGRVMRMTIGAVFAIICEKEGNNFAREGRGRSDSSISLIKLGASYVIAKIQAAASSHAKRQGQTHYGRSFRLLEARK